MVLRTFSAIDSEAFTIDSSSPNGTPGSPIINNSDTPTGTVFTYAGGYPSVSVTLDDTSSDPNRFNDDDMGNHTIVDGKGIVADGTQVESESLHYVRALDANGNQVGPTITVTVFSKGGVTQDVWGMSSDLPLQPGTRYVKTGGSNDGSSDYASFAPCFTAGTLILTPTGERPVETLAVGDLVTTKDRGDRPVRFVARRALRFPPAPDRLKPVKIPAGALGDGLPRRDIAVSPQHRMLLPTASGDEVLCLAKGLTALPGVRVKHGCRRVEYVHVLFDRHEILFAEGAATESFRPGPVALGSMEADVLAELCEIFPGLRTDPVAALGAPARPILTLRQVRALAEDRARAADIAALDRDLAEDRSARCTRLAS